MIGFSLNSIAQTKLTLRQCIETGLKNNLEVWNSQVLLETDAITRNQAKLNMLPDLNGSANHNFNQGRSIDPFTNSPVTQNFSQSNFGLQSGIVLFNGLAYQNYVKQTKLAYEASKMDLQQVKDNLTINIILAYLQVLGSVDQLALARNQLDLAQKQVERLNVQDREGAIKPSDLSDLKGQYAGYKLSIATAENTLETAKGSLFQLLNIPFIKDLELERIAPEEFAAKYEDTPDNIYQTALKQLALIKAVDLRQQSAAKAIKVQRGYLFPTLRFGGNVSTAYSSVAMQNTFVNTSDVPSADYVTVGTDNIPVIRKQENFTSSKINYNDQLNNNLYTSYGFSLNIPIFNAWLQRNRLKQAKINYKNREFVAKTTRTQLNQNVELAYVSMTTTSDRYKALLEQVNAYNESFNAAEIRFNEGVGNSIDYLTVKNLLDQANINLINAKYDYVLRMKVLDYYKGKALW
jgi:outer membrane protein